MNTELVLTGVLPAIVIAAGLSTALVSAALLALYRRAVVRGMGRASGEAESIPPVSAGRDPARGLAVTPAPRFVELTEAVATGGLESDAHGVRTVQRSQRRATIAHALGGLAYALVIATVWMLVAGEGWATGRFLWLTVVYLWPTVIACSLVLAIGRREVLALVALYGALAGAAALWVLARNPEVSAPALALLWAMLNVPATVLFLAFLHERIRSVGPMVFAFMLAGATGAVLLVQAAGSSDAVLRALVVAGGGVGLGASSIIALLTAVGFCLFALLGWAVLRGLGHAYRRRVVSDQSITVDSLWLVFALVQSIGFAFEGPLWMLGGVVAFLACKGATKTGLALLARGDVPGARRPRLLLLRVFSLGRRSNRFFEGFSRLWRRTGSVDMIADPDLVTLAVEPHEFLEFVGGSLSRRFVRSEADLERRLAAIDHRPDRDGRSRVHEFFCHDDTWRLTMQRLARDSTSILMDLRSFGPTNQGCLYELQVLVDSVDLARVVFLVDRTTDRGFLERAFRELWTGMRGDSPNVTAPDPIIVSCHADRQSRRVVATLIGRLLVGRGEASPVPTHERESSATGAERVSTRAVRSARAPRSEGAAS